MRIILFSWEYPPRKIGELADYAKDLATQLAKNKVGIYVVTYHDSLTGTVEESNGINTIRVANPVHTHISVLTWALSLNQEVERAVANIYYQAGGKISLIDAYDWHFIPAAVTFKSALRIPFVYSIESLEDHRSPSPNSPSSMAIRSIEWLGLYEAEKISVKSEWMKSEVVRTQKVPARKITVISPKARSWIKDVLALYKAAAGATRNK